MGRRASMRCWGAQRPRGQSGNSLIEVIISILLLGGIFLTLVAGLLTITRTTQVNERVQAIDAALVTYGEILGTQVNYVPCVGNMQDTYFFAADGFMTGSNDPANPLWRRPNGMAVSVIGVESWNTTTGAFEDRGAAFVKCLSPDTGVQRITYSVTVGSTERTGQIVKRKPARS